MKAGEMGDDRVKTLSLWMRENLNYRGEEIAGEVERGCSGGERVFVLGPLNRSEMGRCLTD